MARQEGEALIHWNRLGSLPQDAEKVLYIRRVVEDEMTKQGGKKGPVDDLIIEQQSPELSKASSKIVNPIVYMFPNVVLRMLSTWHSLQKVDLP